MDFKEGQVYTIINVSEWTACTVKTRVRATGETDQRGRAIFTKPEPRMRKRFTFNGALEEDSTLIFEGEVPFHVDSEIERPGTTPGIVSTSYFRGNACLNLVGHAGTIVYHILKANLNENFSRYDIVMHIDGDKEVPLFPEVPTTHAVVQQIRSAQVAGV